MIEWCFRAHSYVGADVIARPSEGVKEILTLTADLRARLVPNGLSKNPILTSTSK